ncbi:phosphate permease [Mytilinidion resinicola]|uniref:Phosphate permease n=1 Tax=Mytilinidion resinicola TaxID=574789 RepID=A0A6A6Y9J5_9PEZI|nr:phosphate permease [Mytilinidion resinicola]KAF2805223.1 phosphate permease [Mytilinidion resinicola]
MLAFQRVGNSAYRDVPGVYSHIIDPNERRRMALAEIDKASFGWYHLRLIVVTGVGFFTDAYSLFAVNLATAMLGIVFWQDSDGGVMPHNADTAIKVSTSAGAVGGQIFFGYLADVLGRKRMYGIELLIIISATVAQTLCASSKAMSFAGVFVFWRVLMGLGIGGDYPLSAVITSEFASTKWRGSIVAAVFAMQGFGQFAAAIVALVVTTAYKRTLEPVRSISECSGDCLRAVDIMWRIIVGFGSIPGWFALYYRLTIPETPRYTFDVLYDVETASADARRYRSGKKGGAHLDRLHLARAQADMLKYRTPRPGPSEIWRFFSKRSNALKLLGTAGSWFLLDVAFYGINLNSSSVLSVIGFDKKENVYALLQNAAVGQLVLICAGSIPGYWCTVATIDILGRRPIQLAGFTILTVLFCVIGFNFAGLSQKSLLVLYILCQFFFNFGPNATTFLTPAEVFPTRVRATAHGLSAGCGKVGAILAQVVFAPMVNRGATPANPSPWLHGVMQIFALFMFCGIGTTLLVPETKRRSLEELAGETGERGVYELQFVSGFFAGGSGRGGRDGRGKRLEGEWSWRGLRDRYLRVK